MNETSAMVFSIVHDNRPIPGCTISKAVSEGSGHFVSHFSLAVGTDISPESYTYRKIWLALSDGLCMLFEGDKKVAVSIGHLCVTPMDVPVGAFAQKDCVYTEITLREDSKMNSILNDRGVFSLRELLPCQDGKVVNMDLASDPGMKFVLMSFGAGTGLPQHSAPGDALVFALEGEAVIEYEEKTHVIHAGENFKFDKGGAHAIRVEKQFKMALLLTLF